jgi:type III secretion protein C
MKKLKRCFLKSGITCGLFALFTLFTAGQPCPNIYSVSQLSQDQKLIAAADEAVAPEKEPTSPIINFNNVNIVEFLRFVSRLTGKNFIFDPQELRFSVTIISESSAALDDIMAALLQNLKIHGFELIEQGTSFLIHKNKDIHSPAGLLHSGHGELSEPQIATQVFLIRYSDPAKVSAIIRTMASKDALVELFEENKRLVVTDLAANIKKVAELLTALDNPSSGLEIGQYVAQTAPPSALVAMTEHLLSPITKGQTFTLVPHIASNSIFIVASPYLVEKALAVMQKVDLGENISGILSFDSLKFDPELAKKYQVAHPTRKSLTEEELSKLSLEELKRLLRSRGFSDEEIEHLTREELQQRLKQAGEALASAEIQRKELFESALPIGQVESTQFLIQKLQYRKAADLEKTLHAIATSLQAGQGKTKEAAQTDLVITLNTMQSIDESNSIVLTGTASTLAKAKKLIAEIDVPVRQVFIEVLIIDTTMENALNFGVEWGYKVQRQNIAVQGGLMQLNSNKVDNSLNTVTQVPARPGFPPDPHASWPSSVYDITAQAIMTAAPAEGFNNGAIGRKILFKGHGFLALTGLVNALRADVDTRIVINPKITVEHNIPAEVYVGKEVGIKGQSIANDYGTTITTNYQQEQTGVDLKVTPLIGSGDTITLIIDQTLSEAENVQAQSVQNAPPATINQSHTVTRVHMPQDHFLILSGMLDEEDTFTKNAIPCLGGLPLVGSLLFANTNDARNHRCLMFFLRPHILDTAADMDEVTKKQQADTDKKFQPASKQRTPLDDLQEILNL